MRRSLPLFLLAVSCAFSQKSAPPQGVVEVKPDTVIAVVNGRKLTVADFERMLPAIHPNLAQISRSQPKQALTEWAVMELMGKEAETLKLEQDPKIQTKLEEARRQVLANALVDRKVADLKAPEQDVRKYYDANMENMREAQVRIVFVSKASFSQNLQTKQTTSAPSDGQKQKAEMVAKLAREGKDFAGLAKQYSDDRDTGENGGILNLKIRAGSGAVPPSMSGPILKASAGDIVGPIEHETGWYLFRVETVGVPDYDAAHADIEKQLTDARVRSYFEQLRSKATVQLQNDGFWETYKATNKQDGAAKRGGAQ